MRFLRGVACACPIARVSCLARFGDEAAHLRGEVGLRGIQRLALRGCDVALRNAQTHIGLLLGRRCLLRGQLWRNLGRFGPRRVVRSRRSGGNARALRHTLNLCQRRWRWRRFELKFRQEIGHGSIWRGHDDTRQHGSHRFHRGPRKCLCFGFLLGGASTENYDSQA